MTEWTIQKKAFDVVLSVYNFTMDKTMDDAIAAVAKTGTGVVAMKVMAGGFRRVKPTDPIYGRLQRDGAMLAALKWVLNKPNISTTIPSMTDMDQLDENLRAMAEPYASGDDQVLAAHLEQIKPVYCRFCGHCDGVCAKGLPVADMLRILTYADGYRQFALARERFQELPAQHKLVRCGDCAECTVDCPHGVHVSAQLARTQELFA
jgi:predicted aldo/keto reductase-like oxidoreductase